jgi:hypothetical protein
MNPNTHSWEYIQSKDGFRCRACGCGEYIEPVRSSCGKLVERYYVTDAAGHRLPDRPACTAAPVIDFFAATQQGYPAALCDWSIRNCRTMREVWDKCERVDWLLWLALQPDVLSDRELHELALCAASSVRIHMLDQRSIHALDCKRAWLDGSATESDLADARRAAWAASRDFAIGDYSQMQIVRDWSASKSAAWSSLCSTMDWQAAQNVIDWAVAASPDALALRTELSAWLRTNTDPRYICSSGTSLS